jgi:hypothetical protein
MTRLRTCDACSRHVFATETNCPFCAAALAPVQAAPIFKLKGLSRAQRFAMVAAVATPLQLAACSNDTGDTGPAGAGGTSAGGTGTGATGANGSAGLGTRGGGTPQPVYGAPLPPGTPIPGAGTGGGAQPVYGAPVFDAGSPTAGRGGSSAPKAGTGGTDDEDAGTAGAAGRPGPQPVYGAPIPLYGAPIPPSQSDK